MEKTFNESAPKLSEAERHAENEQRKQQGEPQIAGAAGRESVPTKDPKGKSQSLSVSLNFQHLTTCSPQYAEFDPRGGPGSSGNKPIQDPVM